MRTFLCICRKILERSWLKKTIRYQEGIKTRGLVFLSSTGSAGFTRRRLPCNCETGNCLMRTPLARNEHCHHR